MLSMGGSVLTLRLGLSRLERLVSLFFHPSSSSCHSSLHPRGLGFAPSWPVFTPLLSCTPRGLSSHTPHDSIVVHPSWPHLQAYPSWPRLRAPPVAPSCSPIFARPSWPRLCALLVALSLHAPHGLASAARMGLRCAKRQTNNAKASECSLLVVVLCL